MKLKDQIDAIATGVSEFNNFMTAVRIFEEHSDKPAMDPVLAENWERLKDKMRDAYAAVYGPPDE